MIVSLPSIWDDRSKETEKKKEKKWRVWFGFVWKWKNRDINREKRKGYEHEMS